LLLLVAVVEPVVGSAELVVQVLEQQELGEAMVRVWVAELVHRCQEALEELQMVLKLAQVLQELLVLVELEVGPIHLPQQLQAEAEAVVASTAVEAVELTQIALAQTVVVAVADQVT
jgi:hypothetical protein